LSTEKIRSEDADDGHVRATSRTMLHVDGKIDLVL
jgi:hypothetical protein